MLVLPPPRPAADREALADAADGVVIVGAYLLRAGLGDRGALDSAAILAAEVENPALPVRIDGLRAAVAA